jgi:hypothetical protein
VIQDQHTSQISYESEFRPHYELELILLQHPLWTSLKNLLSKGATFPLSPISLTDRYNDLFFHSSRGNHKSCDKNRDFLEKIISEDIERGFALPLPLETLHFLPNASLAPLGCQQQWTINEKGSRTHKYRMTHDQSFPGPSGLSINLRVIKEDLPPIRYSFTLNWLVHYIIYLQQKLPSTRILISKIDMDAAYHHCTISWSTAYESLTIYDGLLLVALRMTFGGSPCPSLWGIISETSTDLANNLIQNEAWDQRFFQDYLLKSIDPPPNNSDNTPFNQAKDLAVKIPHNIKGKVNIYIEDSICIAPDINDNPRCTQYAMILAI